MSSFVSSLRAWPAARLGAFLALVVLTGLPRFAGLGTYPLWHDEAWVAVSVEQSSIAEMLFQFSYPQTTPPLFLMATRMLVAVFGQGDIVLRLLPAVAGLACVVLLFPLTRSMTRSDVAAVFASAMLGTNMVFFRYSQELKQYTTEALATIVLLLLAERYVSNTAGRMRSWIVLTAAAVVSLGFSFSAPFMIATVGLRLAVWAIGRSEARARELAWVVAFGLVTGLVGVLIFVVFVQSNLQVWLYDFWRERGFFPESPHAGLGIVRFIARQTLSIPVFLFGTRSTGWVNALSPAVASLLIVSGCIIWLRARNHAASLYVLAPFALMVTAGVAGIYPYGGDRIMLFAAPVLCIAAANGFAALAERILAYRRPIVAWTAFASVLLFALPIYAGSTTRFHYAKLHIDMRSAVAQYFASKSDDDVASYIDGTEFALLHYMGSDAFERLERIRGWGVTLLSEPMEDVDRIVDVRGAGHRLWLFVPRRIIADEIADTVVTYAARRCVKDGHWGYQNAELHLFDCTGPKPSL